LSTELFELTVLLEARVITLVRQAPELDASDLERAAVAALGAAAHATGELARLALAIERVIDDLAEGEIAPGVGLPAAAMAAYTLQQAVKAGAAMDPLAVRGAVYELETMFPIPSTGRRPTVDEPKPDVPLGNLTSKVTAPAKRVDRAAPARARRLVALEAADAVLARVGELRARYERSS
jgi:hypothetical protein